MILNPMYIHKCNLFHYRLIKKKKKSKKKRRPLVSLYVPYKYVKLGT